MEKTNFHALYLNQVTSYSTMVAKMPICLENDKVAIAAALATTPPRPGGRRFCAIKNTLSLQDVLVSEACLPLLEGVAVRQTPLFEPFINEGDLFTKTGSGQTSKKLRKTGGVFRRAWSCCPSLRRW